MPKFTEHFHSKQAIDAIALLGSLIRLTRLDRRMTAENVAIRAGISRPLLRRIERGDPGCSIGAVFEVAAVVGVPLFDADPTTVTLKAADIRHRLVLMPRAARRSKRPVDDDF